MKQLFLEDLKGLTENEIKKHLIENYAGSSSGFDSNYGDIDESEKKKVKNDLKRFNILIAYESVGSWGCDSSSWFLLKEKSTGDLYEFSGSHCSCYGFEGQYDPDKTDIQYLKSKHFNFYCGGYDENETENQLAVKSFISKMRIRTKK